MGNIFLELRESEMKNGIDCISVSELAEKFRAFIPDSTQNAIRLRIMRAEESGKCNNDLLRAYAQYFGISVENLLNTSRNVTEKNDLLIAASTLGISIETAQQIKNLDNENRELLNQLAKNKGRLTGENLLSYLINHLHAFAVTANTSEVIITNEKIEQSIILESNKAKPLLRAAMLSNIGPLLDDIATVYEKLIERKEDHDKT